MTKIESMYQWSGGTDYRHTCYECRNCLRVKRRGRQVYKCLVYGCTDTAETDWKEFNIACRFYNQIHRGEPLMKMYTGKKQESSDIPGQMSLDDFLGGEQDGK